MVSDWPVLSTVIFTPWAGALLLALWPRADAAAARGAGLVFSLSTLVFGIAMALGVGSGADGVPGASLRFVENHTWIDSLNVSYLLGLDGMSLLLVLLTGLVAPVCLLAAWKEARSPRLFSILFLLLQGCALGVFLAQDFVLWFLFWELSLVPAFFLIKLWGGPSASRAAYQFVVYTLAGSVFMLLAFAAIYATTGHGVFFALGGGEAARGLGTWALPAFLGVFVGLAVKVPLVPFHTWLPDAYAEAPTSVSMFLTAILSKMGVYGFLRILWPLFPEQMAATAPVLLALALGGVVFGAFAAMAQTDLKRMLAYSSVNHVSYCLLALFAVAGVGSITATNGSAVTAALGGALLQMFNHGVSAAALFLCVGVLESRSGGLRGVGDFGGLRSVAPVFAGLCGVALFSSLGLPGLNGFVGEFLVFRGVFALAPWAAAVATIGLLVTAIFLLTLYQRVFLGPRPEGANGFADLDGRENLLLGGLALVMLILGVAPQLLTGLFNPLLEAWLGGLVAR